MRLVVVTSDGDALGGVFAKSYYAAGGLPPAACLVLPERPEIGFRGLDQLRAALTLFGVGGSARIAIARALGVSLTRRDASAGLTTRWLDGLARRKAPLIHMQELNSSDGVQTLRQLNADLLVSIGAPVILRTPVLECASIGAINVHNGRIPEYRGHFATFWEVLNGETWGYTTVHVMADRVDTGRTLGFDRVEIRSCGSFLDLMIEKKARAGALLARLVGEIQRLGRLPDGVTAGPEMRRSAYFRWPSILDIQRFRWPETAGLTKSHPN